MQKTNKQTPPHQKPNQTKIEKKEPNPSFSQEERL